MPSLYSIGKLDAKDLAYVLLGLNSHLYLFILETKKRGGGDTSEHGSFKSVS